MNNYVKLLNNLEELGLLNIKASIDKYIDLINSGNKSIVDALYELSNLEINAKSDRAMQACVKVANFPFLKEVTDFDFDFQPAINKQQILDLMTLIFIENKENILFVGSSGVGKTHLATSIGIECAKHRYSTYFIYFQDLISQLKKALSENRLDIRLRHFCKYKILIIDEIGYLLPCGNQLLIGIHNRFMEIRMAHVASVHEKVLMRAFLAGCLRLRHKTGNLYHRRIYIHRE